MARVASSSPSEVGTKGYFNTLLLAPSATAQSRPRVPTNARVVAAQPDNSAAAASTQDPSASAKNAREAPAASHLQRGWPVMSKSASITLARRHHERIKRDAARPPSNPRRALPFLLRPRWLAYTNAPAPAYMQASQALADEPMRPSGEGYRPPIS
eukprot:CAMPEP_0201626956 /NCGR_PEP_ID=MMETSP0493-20130528/2156_1 /ASSEMBLY_ACC=CAM_ASM_000838 /TAXON_ID=420259 /ORGANISM="Thalassiosira gravida, Strain GMp14c1" /LENGTH=155 /DNA_ID=CAMNT_0048097143 /DNA_START=132 /DNA_END=600 /DNA_ORIENTATION=-